MNFVSDTIKDVSDDRDSQVSSEYVLSLCEKYNFAYDYFPVGRFIRRSRS